jgi:smad nuclear-interacting protein 1
MMRESSSSSYSKDSGREYGREDVRDSRKKRDREDRRDRGREGDSDRDFGGRNPMIRDGYGMDNDVERHDTRRRYRENEQDSHQDRPVDDEDDEPTAPKEAPNYGNIILFMFERLLILWIAVSGALAAEKNMYKGVVLKYSEPVEARKTNKKFRFYIFKGKEQIGIIHLLQLNTKMLMLIDLFFET